MDETANELWYFETWSPQDGIAFASRRVDATDPDGKRAITVALAPPYWRPSQVSLATALRAERESFQEGFLDDNSNPIGFKTLAELTAVVRQAYVGSASGPNPPEGEGAGPPPVPPDSPPDVKADDAARHWPEARKRLLAPRNGKHEAKQVADEVLTLVGGGLETRIRNFAYQSLALMIHGTIADGDEVLGWAQLMVRMGYDSLGVHALASSHLAWSHPGYWPLVVGALRLSPVVLFAVPDPFVGKGHNLGDGLARALSSRGRFEKMSLDEFSVLALTATAVVAATALPKASLARSPDWHRHILSDGIAWLWRQLPTVLSTSQAGRALDKYDWS